MSNLNPFRHKEGKVASARRAPHRTSLVLVVVVLLVHGRRSRAVAVPLEKGRIGGERVRAMMMMMMMMGKGH